MWFTIRSKFLCVKNNYGKIPQKKLNHIDTWFHSYIELDTWKSMWTLILLCTYVVKKH